MSALAIFLGSFLSFFVEPLVGRTLLPWFGGGAAVWVTCLVGFQVLMVVGYFYGGRVKVKLHVPMLGFAALWCVAVAVFRRPVLGSLSSFTGFPAVDVLLGVFFLCAVSFVLLSANATLVQLLAGGNYRLYSISNLGSLCGLAAYPVLVEPFVPVPFQWIGLGVSIAAYGVLLACLARRERGSFQTCADDRLPLQDDSSFPRASASLLYYILPAVSCSLMTALTTYLTTDFVPLPLLWSAILAAFLLSYVIGFSRLGGEHVGIWVGVSLPSLALAVWAFLPNPDNIYRFYWNAGAAASLLLVVCTALHSWLYRIRPSRAGLPRFYFAIAVGGAIGGIVAGVLPPLVFGRVLEYPLSLLAVIALFAFLLAKWVVKENVVLNRIGHVVLAICAIVVVHVMSRPENASASVVCRLRGFYGVNEVQRSETSYGLDGKKGEFHAFFNGRTEHGAQLWADGEKEKPRSYYSLNGGSVPFLEHPKRKAGKPLRAAFVGMGIGSLAACGREGDYFRFYEISHEVVAIATNSAYFTFLSDCKAKCDVVVGDARLELEKDKSEGIGKFDIIVVDAYSGDSIPTHLVTAEAFRLYRSLLEDDGILACHLSNWHMDLWPVMKSAAKSVNLDIYGWVSGPVYSELVSGTYWAMMTEKPFRPRLPTCCHIVDFSRVDDRPLITDDCGSLIFNIRFNYFPPYLYE